MKQLQNNLKSAAMSTSVICMKQKGVHRDKKIISLMVTCVRDRTVPSINTDYIHNEICNLVNLQQRLTTRSST